MPYVNIKYCMDWILFIYMTEITSEVEGREFIGPSIQEPKDSMRIQEPKSEHQIPMPTLSTLLHPSADDPPCSRYPQDSVFPLFNLLTGRTKLT